MTAPYRVLCSADDPEWLKLRRIGGSDIATLMGCGYSTPLRLWAEKRGLLEPEDISDRDDIWWGNKLEPLVAERFQQKADVQVERWAELLQSIEHEWATATPDYRTADGQPVQIKTTKIYNRKDWAEGPPEHVYWQCQHEMLVTGADICYAVALLGSKELAWTIVDRDENAIEWILIEGENFWRMVQDGIPPDPTDKDDDTLHSLYPHGSGESLALPGEYLEYSEALEDIKQRIKDMEAEEGELKNMMKSALGNADYGYFPDGSGYSWREQERYALKPANGSIPKREGDMVEAIVTRSQFRVLRHLKAKES